jgi:pseudouridylate synthase / pseudouridine kinase
VTLASVVADDLAGSSLLEHLARSGLRTTDIERLPTSTGARTAQYVAVNDTNKDLVVAMADMAILDRPEMESMEFWSAKMEQNKPRWVVVDANWSPTILSSIFTAAKTQGSLIAFEPVSIAKAARLFHRESSMLNGTKVVPNHVVSLSTPNSLELKAMYEAARDSAMFESSEWWSVINGFGFSSAGSQDRLISVAGRELVEQGIPQQCIQLVPFIPNLVTKLGAKGCLLTCLLRRGDDRLTNPANAPYILSRSTSESEIGGLYMRLFPPSTVVEQAVSVNGIGDTMLGVMVTGLANGRQLEDVMPTAQEAAVLTLQSPEAVSPQVRTLRSKLR